MKKRFAVAAFVVAGAALAAGTLHAHHSYGDFDLCKRVALRGKIETLAWVNPHVLLGVRDSNAIMHRVEWFSLIQATRENVIEGILQVGDDVVVTGSAHRDPQKRVISRVVSVERPSDGWKHARQNSALPTACAESTAASGTVR